MSSTSIWTMKKLALVSAGLLACGALAAARLEADETAALGRGIIGKWEKAVVTVKVVTKTRVISEGREMGKQESTTEPAATIIHPSGLAVLSLSEADPAEMYRRMMGEEEDYKWESEITDVKLRLADGKELRAKIVLRDRDLDLAFVRPVEPPAEPLLAIELTAGPKPELLEEILILGRLGEVANRVPAASLDRIQAVIEKPRTFYVPASAGILQSLGCPAFSLDGKVLGILILRTMPSTGGGMFESMGDGGMLPVILPASDVLEAAEQAPKE